MGWYNGFPDDKDLKFNLDSEDLLIIGQGNVAIDVARIILTPVDILRVKFYFKIFTTSFLITFI